MRYNLLILIKLVDRLKQGFIIMISCCFIVYTWFMTYKEKKKEKRKSHAYAHLRIDPISVSQPGKTKIINLWESIMLIMIEDWIEFLYNRLNFEFIVLNHRESEGKREVNYYLKEINLLIIVSYFQKKNLNRWNAFYIVLCDCYFAVK